MSVTKTDLRAYWLIRRGRFAKKKKVYKQVAAVVFDLTTAIYVAALVGYIGMSLFLTGNITEELAPFFTFVEENASKGYLLLLSVLPIRYIVRSFQHPGILFSTSEYQLGLLPFKREKIWAFIYVEKLLKLLLFFGSLAALLILVTPISSSLIISYLTLFAVYDLVMTVPQWKLFQQRFWMKAGWLLLFILSNLIAVILESELIGLIQLVLIIFAHIVILRRLFMEINWVRVTELSDYYIWNMLVVSQVSQTKFKKKKSYSILQNSTRRKRSFATKFSIYHRLWQLYLAKNLGVIAQVIGAILLMLVAFQFFEEWIYYIGMAIAIHVYTVLCANLFHNRFQADIVELLPWDLSMYKRTYFKWMAMGGGLLFLPIFSYFIRHWDVWAPFQLVFIISVFLYAYHVNMDKTIILLAKKSGFLQLREGLSLLFIILVAISHMLPVISLTAIGIAWGFIFSTAKQ
ncbi:hypothetical protein [Virgibacillus salinus]|uniref:Uncharacterized protein n=1 Tax=Virgibacillus salinus TaxID=553311 RepID=A0A1H1EPB2_9BACI|nr:hypothetical protein [Virgibacillus salinus]SDQ90460.1 hypothetical protein SAMN05216231_2978 [Virgibacillus salinus]